MCLLCDLSLLETAERRGGRRAGSGQRAAVDGGRAQATSSPVCAEPSSRQPALKGPS